MKFEIKRNQNVVKILGVIFIIVGIIPMAASLLFCMNDRIKKLIDLSKVESSTEHLSPELIESVWSQMPEVVKPMYGSTKEEIATNYYKEYSYLFK